MSEHIQRVRVTNGNSFAIDDRFDGVPYEFPAGQTVIIPPDAAQHIFGFPGEEADMMVHMARRFGWNRPEHYHPDESKGQRSWQQLARAIKIAVEHYDVVRRTRAPHEAIPAEEADEAPDMLGLNIDPPAPKRGSVGRGGRKRGTRMKRTLQPRRPEPATQTGDTSTDTLD